MNNYIKEFKKIYKDLIDKYEFSISHTFDGDSIGEIVLYNTIFELHFIMWRETTDVIYFRLLPNNKVMKCNISNFIKSQATENDLIIIDASDDERALHTTVYNNNIKTLKYLYNILNNHFADLLSGGEKWIQLFEKSEWYSEPIIRERKI